MKYEVTNEDEITDSEAMAYFAERFSSAKNPDPLATHGLTGIGNVPIGRVVNVPADKVNLPEHYARFAIEPIRFIGENKLDWFQGNIVKYVLRHDAKNGIEDLHKARRYLDMYI